MQNMKSISYGSKVIAKVKVYNSHANTQTEKQDKNNMPPIIRPGAKKLLPTVGFELGIFPLQS